MANPKKYEFNGKKQTLPQWAKETGLAVGTLTDRLANGWSSDKALTVIPDSGNRGAGNGKILRSGILGSLLKVWEECGREEFEKELATKFKNGEAIKTIISLQNLFPKEVEQGEQKPVAALTINNILPDKDFGSRFIPIGGK